MRVVIRGVRRIRVQHSVLSFCVEYLVIVVFKQLCNAIKVWWLSHELRLLNQQLLCP
jgi:hypothetical protein